MSLQWEYGVLYAFKSLNHHINFIKSCASKNFFHDLLLAPAGVMFMVDEMDISGNVTKITVFNAITHDNTQESIIFEPDDIRYFDGIMANRPLTPPTGKVLNLII